MRKKLAATLGALALAGAAVAITGGTYAYFNAQDTTGTQRITAGSLTVELPGGATGVTPHIDIKRLKPGDVYRADDPDLGWYGGSYRMTVANTGDIDGVIERLEVVDNGPGTGGPTGVNLADRLQVRFADRPDPAAAGARRTDWQPLGVARFTGLESWGRLTGGGPTPTKDLYLQIRWPNGTPAQDNPYQGATTQFKVRVTVSQADVGG